jgi:hypothetical protein
MKDIFGSELSVGDKVAFNKPGKKYLITGTVTKINEKMIRIQYSDPGAWDPNPSTNEYPSNVAKKHVDL